MLVIGIDSAGIPFHADLDIDIDVDTALQVHNALSRKAKGKLYYTLLCIENDAVVAEYNIDEDYGVEDELDEYDSSEDELNDGPQIKDEYDIE